LLVITVAGTVTDETLTAVDWLPTLASLVGEPKLVPTARSTA
jgi:arylsulfatase A-like enzyme